MYKSILVCVDLHHLDRSKDIIDRAKSLQGPDSKVTLLNVVDSIPSYVEAYIPGDILASRASDAQEKLANVAKSASLQAEIKVRTGNPHQEILEEAEKSKVDIILLASHNPGMQDYLIGSTAARVVRHAQCSVLIDRKQEG